jgi:hypothetical protein
MDEVLAPPVYENEVAPSYTASIRTFIGIPHPVD